MTLVNTNARRRNRILTILLTLVVLGSLISLGSFVNDVTSLVSRLPMAISGDFSMAMDTRPLSSSGPAWHILSFLWTTVTLAGVFYWKKWGVYSLFILLLAQTVVELVIDQSFHWSVSWVIRAVAGLLWFAAIRREWRYF